MSMENEFKEWKESLLKSTAALDHYNEAKFRRVLAERVRTAMCAQKLSVRKLAAAMATSKSQVQRLLNEERGSGLTLLTLVKAARALDLIADFGLRSKLVSVTYAATLEKAWTQAESSPAIKKASPVAKGGSAESRALMISHARAGPRVEREQPTSSTCMGWWSQSF